jgi:hypothetical protein
MKQLLFSLAFMLIGSFAFANSSFKSDTSGIIELDSTEFYGDFTQSEIVSTQDCGSCTLTTVTQVISNGEVTYQSTVIFHTDAMSCEEFFGLLSAAMSVFR